MILNGLMEHLLSLGTGTASPMEEGKRIVLNCILTEVIRRQNGTTNNAEQNTILFAGRQKVSLTFH